MAMAFFDAINVSVEISGSCSSEEDGFARAEAHGRTHVSDAFLFFLEAYDGMRGVFVKFGGIGVFESAFVAGEFDGGDLHPEADAEIRDVVFASVFGGEDFSFDTAISESTGNKDAIDIADDGFRTFIFNRLSFYADDLDFGIMEGSGVDEGFVNRFIGVLKFDVFSGNRDGDFVFRVNDALHKAFPFFKVR